MNPLLKNYHYLISAVLGVALICVALFFEGSGPESKLTLIALLGTALIYSFQLGTMNQQKELSEKSFDKQERILEEQKNIAQKQYDFDVFQMRVNLRNELYKEFTFILSAKNQDLDEEINLPAVNITKICNDIGFAFPVDEKLKDLLLEFRKCCTDIDQLARDRKVIAECSKKGTGLVYKECVVVWSRDKNLPNGVMDRAVFEKLNISQKGMYIIFDILGRYVDKGDNITDTEIYVLGLFKKAVESGRERIKQIFAILDEHISLI
ncbi:MAG: hypothetical protein FWD33_03130 [Alphaproteobacteria bacterium]|nr:hypothetical protein [Alphaproteobacteria bacterium]